MTPSEDGTCKRVKRAALVFSFCFIFQINHINKQ